MAGYKGQSMSYRAEWAYGCGEMPMSKWSKREIIFKIEEYFESEGFFDDEECSDEVSEKMELIRKLTFKELKSEFLRWQSWHHTGPLYRQTDFYGIEFDFVDDITIEELKKIISSRPKRVRRSQEEIDAEKAEKEEKRRLKAERREKENLFHYQKKYRTLSGFMRSNSVDFDALRKVREKLIEEKREELRRIWTKSDRPDLLEKLENEYFVEYYVRRRISQLI